MSVNIHPTAIIETGAELGTDVSIGAYSVIGSNVKIGDGSRIASQVVIEGHTELGANNQVFSFTAIGGEPQSISYKGEPTQVSIGDNNVFRENITVNRGTVGDEGITSIGSNNLFMAYVHIAHDCRLGSGLLFSNNASLAGHVRVGDYVVLAGYTLVHQFVRIGEHSFCGVNTYCTLDVPPYMLVAGNKAITHGINIRGLRHRGIDKDTILELKRAYRTIYRSGHTMAHALDELATHDWDSPQVKGLISFIKDSKRGVIR
ncbi:MAG: UDP-N-acetylglucosamine acyltransferase [Arenicella sp.]|jgi:UDP-N-acetylglucosamine acyltransferase